MHTKSFLLLSFTILCGVLSHSTLQSAQSIRELKNVRNVMIKSREQINTTKRKFNIIDNQMKQFIATLTINEEEIKPYLDKINQELLPALYVSKATSWLVPIIKAIPGLSYTITGNLVLAAEALTQSKDLLTTAYSMIRDIKKELVPLRNQVNPIPDPQGLYKSLQTADQDFDKAIKSIDNFIEGVLSALEALL